MEPQIHCKPQVLENYNETLAFPQPQVHLEKTGLSNYWVTSKYVNDSKKDGEVHSTLSSIFLNFLIIFE